MSDDNATFLERLAGVVLFLSLFAAWSFGDTGASLVGYRWNAATRTAGANVTALWDRDALDEDRRAAAHAIGARIELVAHVLVPAAAIALVATPSRRRRWAHVVTVLAAGGIATAFLEDWLSVHYYLASGPAAAHTHRAVRVVSWLPIPLFASAAIALGVGLGWRVTPWLLVVGALSLAVTAIAFPQYHDTPGYNVTVRFDDGTTRGCYAVSWGLRLAAITVSAALAVHAASWTRPVVTEPADAEGRS